MYLFCISCKYIIATIKVPTLIIYRAEEKLIGHFQAEKMKGRNGMGVADIYGRSGSQCGLSAGSGENEDES